MSNTIHSPIKGTKTPDSRAGGGNVQEERGATSEVVFAKGGEEDSNKGCMNGTREST